MNITIAGYGFVGQAHEAVLKDFFNTTIYDPFKGFDDFGEPDAVIVCVATPPHEDGSCNVNNVADVISRVDEAVPVLIKSTLSLEGWRSLRELFPDHQLAFSPEFLRAAAALHDFKESNHIYIGGDSITFWHSIFVAAFGLQFTTTVRDPEALVLAKCFRNSYLATKVAFFNQAYDVCEAAGVDYDTVRSVVAEDSRIGHSHTHVTHERGFGGHCFPKDTSALLRTAEKFKAGLTILKEAVQYNKSIRRK